MPTEPLVSDDVDNDMEQGEEPCASENSGEEQEQHVETAMAIFEPEDSGSTIKFVLVRF